MAKNPKKELKMKSHISRLGDFTIINILDSLTLTSDITELRTLVVDNLQNNPPNIAIAFSEDSFLSSKSVSVLVTATELVRDAGGRMVIINPNDSIKHLLHIIAFDGLVDVVQSTSQLSSFSK
jgi:anti-anti-sigma factor